MIERVAKAISAKIGDQDWRDSIYLAKAAIEAMREPTQNMMNGTAGLRGDPSDPEIYRAMIDAALQSDNEGR